MVVASNNQTEAIGSVIFFVFVVITEHGEPKYLARKRI